MDEKIDELRRVFCRIPIECINKGRVQCCNCKMIVEVMTRPSGDAYKNARHMLV